MIGSQAANGGVQHASNNIEVVPLSNALGAEVLGCDLSLATNVEYTAIHAAFLDHHLLVFRKQAINDADILRFAEFFGEIENNQVRDAKGGVLSAVHSIANVDEQGRPSVSPLLKTNYSWHSDKSYLPRPSLMTMLYGLEVPPVGGDTEFSNMETAYDDLPDEKKRRLVGLKVIQSFDYMLDNLGRPPIIATQDIPPPVKHPLVRTHPDTGRKSLFVGMYSESIAGMPETEGRNLIAELLAHATQERYRFTQKWQPCDFVAWDNRSLIHRAIPNYDMGVHRRVLRRCVVRGGVPQ
jgi:alpha-ketoglutarate-dependent taurine dioxygenase